MEPIILSLHIEQLPSLTKTVLVVHHESKVLIRICETLLQPEKIVAILEQLKVQFTHSANYIPYN